MALEMMVYMPLRIQITFPSHLSSPTNSIPLPLSRRSRSRRLLLHQPSLDALSTPIIFSINAPLPPGARHRRHRRGCCRSDLADIPPFEVSLPDKPKWFKKVVAKRKVAIFWDVDNKAPKHEAYDVALEVRSVASAFGEVVKMVAFLNEDVFNFIPMYENEARRKRRELDELEMQGLVTPPQPYSCKVCLEKFPIHVDLRNHVLNFHAKGRERVKRLLKAEVLPQNNRPELEKRWRRHMEGSRKVLVPEAGYNLDYELERAGVEVGIVPSNPQATDAELKSAMWKELEARGANCLFLISDDTDYEDVLLAAGEKGWQRVVVSETNSLKKSADVWLSWFELNKGKAKEAALEASQVYLLELRQKEAEKKKLDKKIHVVRFKRMWRKDDLIKREGGCIVQSKHTPRYIFSEEDLMQPAGSE